jgi:hypothetical protein
MTFEDNRGAARDLVEAWVRRPPMISAAIARTRVLARIAEKRRLRPFFLAASASAALGLLLALMVAVPKWSAEPVAEIATVTAPSAPHQSMLIYELSSGTTLYFALTEEASAGAIGQPAGGQGDDS